MNSQTPQYNPFVIDCNCVSEQYNFIPAGYEFFLRTVRFYEIQFITGGGEKAGGVTEKAGVVAEKTGVGKLIIDGQHHEPRKGDLFFLKPGMKIEGVSGFFSYVVCFDPVFSESRRNCYQSDIPFWASNDQTMLPDGGYFNDLPLKYNTSRVNELEPLFFNIFQAFFDDRHTNQPVMNAVLLEIISIIYEEIDDDPSKFLLKPTANQYYERVMASKQFIDENLGNKLSLETLALQFGSSPSFFSRIFKKVIGITPFEYIIESRLTLARKLLATTGESVEQIADACGFDDISYFYRLFKRRFNMTPALFKEGYGNRGQAPDAYLRDGNLHGGQVPEDTENNKGGFARPRAGEDHAAPGNFVTQSNPAEAPKGHESNLAPAILSINPYILGFSYNNEPTNLYPLGIRTVPRVVRFYEIELIIGGAGKKIIDGHHFKASRGDIFFRKPGMVNQVVSGYFFYEIAFDPVYSELRRYCYESPIPFYHSDPNTILPNRELFPYFPYKYHTSRLSEFEPLFASIIQSFPKRKEEQQFEIREILVKILTMVNEELRVNQPVSFENQVIKNNYERIMACKKLIEDHPEQKISLEMLADMCGLSRNFFCKIFKQIVGKAPLEYVNETRIRLAKKLLVSSPLSIEEISSRCGFDDPTFFYRLFKRHSNMTPNTFRQKSNLIRQDE